MNLNETAKQKNPIHNYYILLRDLKIDACCNVVSYLFLEISDGLRTAITRLYITVTTTHYCGKSSNYLDHM